MLETIFKGSKSYWTLVTILAGLIAVGAIFYIKQLQVGLGITGMSRDVSWGFYIAQLTFLVGVAAGGVMLVLPYYLHNYKKFGKITILGEFLAIASIIMCLLFVMVDLGQPARALNLWLHPTLHSVLFWDSLVLFGYLFLNLLVGWTVLDCERNAVPPPKWIKPFIYLSIPFAFGIHTVTAFLYCGLPGRHFWLTAVLAPRFLASAFAAGPAFVIILCLILKKYTKFNAGKDAVQALSRIITYALLANIFLFLCEVFVAMYSQMPSHMVHLQYLFFGLHGHNALVPYMWAAMTMMAVAIFMLLVPSVRKNESYLAIACVLTFVGIWIDKGLGMITGGFVPNPLHQVTEYMPTFPELMISIGIYSIGGLILTFLFKMAVSVREEVSQDL
ncbi:MAG: polysulfide reductase NrfD [Fibrobacteria bacterium]|nr:polysulfide reductase NrfD [Fibrobacteria bacterium]